MGSATRNISTVVASALARLVIQCRHMDENPPPLGARVCKRHRKIIKQAARKLRVSEGVVRRAFEAFVF
jgi:hypothetical protein